MRRARAGGRERRGRGGRERRLPARLPGRLLAPLRRLPPDAERKARSPRAEEVALQVLREAFPTDEGWVLTHNRGGIGGQNDNVCRVVGAGAAEELTNRPYRVDFVLWNRRNPNRIALSELGEHQPAF